MGFLHNIPDRVAFTVFGIDIMWYGLLIGIGMVLAVILAYRRAPKHGLDPDRLLDIVIWCIPAGVIGARLYYVAFQWDSYKGDLKSILNIRQGGLAIHGGLIFSIGLGVILVKFLWKERPLEWADLCAPSIALGQAIGRWGNYFNQEAYGVETDLPWGMLIDGKTVHPTFLYESVWCFLLCLFLIWFADSGRQKFTGQIFSLYLMLYSVERFFVEGLRTDSLMVGPLRQAQVMSLALFALGAAGYVILRKYGKNDFSDPQDRSEKKID